MIALKSVSYFFGPQESPGPVTRTVAFRLRNDSAEAYV